MAVVDAIQAAADALDRGVGVATRVQVAGDDVLLGELCANLLENAIKYTPEQGIVTVYLRTANRVFDLSLKGALKQGRGILASDLEALRARG